MSQLMLTLRNWPIEEMPRPQRALKLSPTTSKILKSADIQIQSLLPISREEFAITNNLNIQKKEQIEDLYEMERQKRIKKVNILKGLWQRISSKSKRMKSDHSSNFSKKENMSLSQHDSSRSGSLFNKTLRQKPSPLFFKGCQSKKNSAYLDYYSNSKNGKLINKKYSNEDESTKSRQNIKQKMNLKTSPNRDYFGLQQKKSEKKKKKKQSKSNHKTKEICLDLLDEINQAMGKWTQMDIIHREEKNQMEDLSQRENRRLMKIQQIEKEKLKQQIEEVRIRLAASKKLGKQLF